MLRQFPLYTDDYTEYTGSIFINLFINILKANEFITINGPYQYNGNVPSWTENDKNFMLDKANLIKTRYDQMYNFLDEGECIPNVDFITDWLHNIENYIDFLLFYDRIYEKDKEPICFEQNDDSSIRWIACNDYKVEIEMTIIENPLNNSILSSKKDKYITFYRIYYKNKNIVDIIDNDIIDNEDNNLEVEDALIISECLGNISRQLKIKLHNIFNSNNISWFNEIIELEGYINDIDKEEIKKNVSNRTERNNNRSSHFRSPFRIFRSKDSV